MNNLFKKTNYIERSLTFGLIALCLLGGADRSYAGMAECTVSLEEKIDFTEDVLSHLDGESNKVSSQYHTGYRDFDLQLLIFSQKSGFDMDTVFGTYKVLKNSIRVSKYEQVVTATKLTLAKGMDANQAIELWHKMNQIISVYDYGHYVKLFDLLDKDGSNLESLKEDYSWLRNNGGLYSYKKDLIGLMVLAHKSNIAVNVVKDIYSQIRNSNRVYSNDYFALTKVVQLKKTSVDKVIDVYQKLRDSNVVYSKDLGQMVNLAMNSEFPLEGMIDIYKQASKANLYSSKDRMSLVVAYAKFGVKFENSYRIYQAVRTRFSNRYGYSLGSTMLYAIAEGYPIGIDHFQASDPDSAETIESADID